MEAVKEKAKKKSKGKTALKIILCVIIVIALAAVIFINVTTKPTYDTDENCYAVGGMVISDAIEYQDESGEGIKHNPIIRIMQMVWRFCSDGDAAKHAKQTPPTNLVKDVDIPYIDDGNIYHRLDVYYPSDRDDVRSLPMIVDIHGGGWMYGDKNLNEYYCLELARRGYVVFNISYRLVPDVTVNEQIQDCLAAMRYINAHYTKYTDNADMLLTGDSAGGMLAAYTATVMQSGDLQTTFNAPYELNGIQPKALLLTSPVAFMKDGGAFSVYTKILWGKDYKTKATYDYMDLGEIVDFAKLPPTYLITSGGDSLANEQTHRAYDLLTEKGVKCEIADFGDDENGKPLPHVFSVLFPFDQSGDKAITDALAFYEASH